MKGPLFLALALVLLLLTLAACKKAAAPVATPTAAPKATTAPTAAATSTSPAPTPTVRPTTAPSTATPTVPPTPTAVLKTGDHAVLGKIVTDPTGRTLYRFDRDTPGVSTCTGPCLATWPPLAAPAGGITGVSEIGRASCRERVYVLV